MGALVGLGGQLLVCVVGRHRGVFLAAAFTTDSGTLGVLRNVGLLWSACRLELGCPCVFDQIV